jgi:hypothetical protein
MLPGNNSISTKSNPSNFNPESTEMNDYIEVTADGHVHVGGNQWASLEEIQQAVLERQNPGLTGNCDGSCQQPNSKLEAKLMRMQRNELFAKVNKGPNAEPHLPLPSTLVRNQDDDKRTPVANDEHLPLPSTARP